MGESEERLARLKWLGLGAAAIWVILVVAYGAGFIGTRAPGGLSLLLTLLGLLIAAVLPVALILAVLVLLGRQDGHLAAEKALSDRIDRLDADLRKLRQDLRAAPARAADPVPPVPEPEPEPEPEPAAPDPVAAQPYLPLTDDSGAAFSAQETIRALNFPQNAQDQAGFDILARALARHDLAQILQASEDCLNYLAHLGLYMDDLMPAQGTAQDWRDFAEGGPARAALLPLTGITDQAALAKVKAEMRADPIFRDAALHFQRRFDRMLTGFAPTASDAELLDLIDTRTGRAFILLAQVSGTLDG